jgi:hypothetical protein
VGFRVALEADHYGCASTCRRFAEIRRGAPIDPNALPKLEARDILAAFVLHDLEIVARCRRFV